MLLGASSSRPTMLDSRSIGQPGRLLTDGQPKASNLKVVRKEELIVNNKVLRSSITLAFFVVALLSGFGAGAPAQTSATTAAPPALALSYLPASDAIVLIDVRRLLNETMPSVLAGDQAKLATANAEIDKFKTRTGIDLRSFDRVVLGMRYTYPSARVTKLETVVIAHGTFDAKGLAAAGRIAANGKFREEKYRGATILIFTINDQIKLLGLWDIRVNELAVCALDANSLAIGTLPNVQAAIIAGKRGGANSALAALATRDPNAVIGFGANVPRELMANLNVGNDTIAKDANSIRQAYGSIGSTASDLSLVLVARTDSLDSARNLSDTITGLKQLGGIFVAQMAQPRKGLAQSALDNLKITTRATEVEIKTQVASASLASVIK